MTTQPHAIYGELGVHERQLGTLQINVETQISRSSTTGS